MFAGKLSYNNLKGEKMNEQAKSKKQMCERCEKDAEELFQCEHCDSMICDSCTVTYDQFPQVDYTLCKGCKDTHDWDEE